MTKLIDADLVLGKILGYDEYFEDCGCNYISLDAVVSEFNHAEEVDAIPIKWLYEQSDNPDRSDRFRNACDLVAMTWLEEREDNDQTD